MNLFDHCAGIDAVIRTLERGGTKVPVTCIRAGCDQPGLSHSLLCSEHYTEAAVAALAALRPTPARAHVPQSRHDKANRQDGTWVAVDYHALTFDVWFRVEGIYIPATEFDAEERPDVVISTCELYASEVDFDSLPQSVRAEIIEACREAHRDFT